MLSASGSACHIIYKVYVFFPKKKAMILILILAWCVPEFGKWLFMEVIYMFLENKVKDKIGAGEMFRPEFTSSEPMLKSSKNKHLSF